MCEESSDNNYDMNEVPIRALSMSTRHQLSQYLNGEQVITTSNGLSRDYRGIAQLMGFEYSVITNVLRTNDPFNSLLEMYQNRSDATFQQLFKMIERIERFDIIDDLTPILFNDAKHYLLNKKSNNISVQSSQNSLNTINGNCEEIINYDAYVCYADNDLSFVQQLSQYLEYQNGLRLFIRDRDMLLGSWVYQSFAQLIESQCRRVLIILSPHFLDCPECEFQTAFATGLAIEQRNRKLIPIIYKKCDLPPIIKMLTKIDMTKGENSPEWSWNRLKNSISNTVINPSIVYRQNDSCLALPSIASNNSQIVSIRTINDSLITLPYACPTPTAPPMVTSQSHDSEISQVNHHLESQQLLSQENNSKKSNPKKWIQSIKQKFKVHN